MKRRLNVAIPTRAKRRMALISSFAAERPGPDLGPRRRARTYFGSTSPVRPAQPAARVWATPWIDKPKLNPFEVDVRDSLSRAGVPLIAQYGCLGLLLPLDYAAQHPTKRGQMVLAIECDPVRATNSSPTAR